MKRSSARYPLPPSPRRADGALRRVGIEIEFGALTLSHAVRVAAEALDATPRRVSAVRYEIEGSPLGPFALELDSTYIKEHVAAAGADGAARAWADVLETVGEHIVPTELVCPPLPADALARLDAVVVALREAGARGTERSLVAAYGVQVNAEVPALEAGVIAPVLRAFALLQWWLIDARGVDLTRRLWRYVDPWPRAYLEAVLEDGAPDLDRILDDYLAHNADRNRTLDLLPLLAEIDEERVREAVPDPLVKRRPAYHYRLPDCRIEDPSWSLADPWSEWLLVERLAASTEDLDRLAERFLEKGRGLLGAGRRAWVAEMDRWLGDRGWA